MIGDEIMITPARIAAAASAVILMAGGALAQAEPGTLLSRSLQSAGAADKELRTQSGELLAAQAQPDFKTSQVKFEKAIEAAQVPRGPPRIENYQLNDGRPASRIISRDGVWCSARRMTSDAAVDAFKDGAFNDGVKTQRLPCS